MTLKQWLLDLFKDERGSTSVKPFIALLGTLSFIAALIINLITHNPHTVDNNIIDAIVAITIVAMTGDTVDKFSLKKKPESPIEPADTTL